VLTGLASWCIAVLQALTHPAASSMCRLARLAVPLAGAHFFNFALSLITLAFVGHLGEFELSVAVLATSFFNVTGLSILIGLVGEY
jgi:Na+-driven multidrug efflux pump